MLHLPSILLAAGILSGPVVLAQLDTLAQVQQAEKMIGSGARSISTGSTRRRAAISKKR
jgi:hypothetical protein